MVRSRFRESAGLTAIAVLSIGGGFFGGWLLIGPEKLPFIPALSYSAPAKLSPAEAEGFIQERAATAGYEELSSQARGTWDIVADVLYRKLDAYNLEFELTDDPEKNCARTIHNSAGGCYRGTGEHAFTIFISPEIDAANAEFIAYHEYAHYLQHMDGGTRFVDDFECDADLRAAELRGGWIDSVFMDRCLERGIPRDQILHVAEPLTLETKRMGSEG